jgi:hypothetical protein
MSRRFVIGVQGLDRDQARGLREFLSDQGGWWHWIDSFWLLRTVDDANISTAKIRDRIGMLNPSARTLVLEVSKEIDWSGQGRKNGKGQSMYDWLNDDWQRD